MQESTSPDWMGPSSEVDNTISRSPGTASNTLREALLSWTPYYSTHGNSSQPTGPWDELADWYWGYWEEIEDQLSGPLDNRIPPKSLRDELVLLYFKHVHPLCPIFDEVGFHTCYYCSDEDDSFLEVTTYHSCRDESPIALARAALLLSYWSPYSSEQLTNNYWVDQAFIHARAACLHEQQQCMTPPVSQGRMRLIWWSLVLRDRLVAFALRRSHRMHRRIPDIPLPSLGDFEIELHISPFVDVHHKRQYVNSFIAQCELSRVIAHIVMFQERRTYPETSDGRGLNINSELEEVALLHLQLDHFIERFEILMKQVSSKAIDRDGMPCQMTKIYHSSAVAALHLPYIAPTKGKYPVIHQTFSETALQYVRDAVTKIAKCTEALAYSEDSNDIPLAIGAWVALPIAVKVVFLSNGTNLENPSAEIQEMRTLMNLLRLIKSRFSGGRFLANVLGVVISQVFLVGNKNDRHEFNDVLQDAASMIDKGLAHGIMPSAKL
ncbi:hypothetical protein B7463_g1274, partial [Scytalidium lignicola]